MGQNMRQVRRVNVRTGLAVLCLAAMAPLHASRLDPVTWSLQAQQAEATPGSTVMLRLHAQIAVEYHLYSFTTPVGGPIKTRAALEFTPDVKAIQIYPAYLFAELARLGVLESELFVDNDKFRNRERLNPDPEAKRLFMEQIRAADDLASHVLAVSPKPHDYSGNRISAFRTIRYTFASLTVSGETVRSALYNQRTWWLEVGQACSVLYSCYCPCDTLLVHGELQAVIVPGIKPGADSQRLSRRGFSECKPRIASRFGPVCGVGENDGF
jgi:hypothetical protein